MKDAKSEKKQNAYLAPRGFEYELKRELKNDLIGEYGRLFWAYAPAHPVYWWDNIWYDVKAERIQSINDAAQKLRAIQRNWGNYAFDFHRRSELVVQKLPPLKPKRHIFGAPVPTAPLGGFCLLAPDEMLYAAKTASPFIHGMLEFEENKIEPPNRAYLKLWEVFTRLGIMPEKGARCLDLGASPGGWTWVLASLGAEVICVDKAPLAEGVMAMPGVHFEARNAFTLAPSDVPPLDWLFSDIICYPDKLYELIIKWLSSGRVKNMVCTLKFQGETNYTVIEKLSALTDTKIIHLYHNKHELTFILTQKEEKNV
jgi:23S rRNA (cytidine2498-2'-O)-methyltransferase